MAKIASPVKIRRRLHALPVALGLIVLSSMMLFTGNGLG
jgi:hypothetical protein